MPSHFSPHLTGEAGGAVAIPLYIGSEGIAGSQCDNLGRRADDVLRGEPP